jgi:hypothetical protein
LEIEFQPADEPRKLALGIRARKDVEQSVRGASLGKDCWATVSVRHSRQAFKDEYMDFPGKFEIEHNAKYLFEWIQ